ncbi:MAG TPA: Ig-like domain-containing protein, partial [Candidatus Manganitrophaceae bacterium]|nr:Ig-like domain-containing protein [Candidatus Manganitrophaceae bacterium]
MMASIRSGIVFGLSLFLFACGGGGGGDNGSVTQIEVTPAQANLTPGQTVQFTAVAKTASGKVVAGVPFTWQSDDPSVATVDANGVATGKTVGVAGVVAASTSASGTLSGSATLGVVSPASGSANLSISGPAQYQDRPFDKNGFTGALVPTPIRGAIVNLIAIDGFATLATGATADDGTFSFTGISNTSRRAGLYLQVVSKTAPANPTQVEIRDNPDDRALFALASPGL